MASKPEVGATIVLDGAKEYQQSLNEVTTAQRSLNKEMKLAESEFKATGDAQKLYNEKIRILNASMDNQKKKLETAQKALKELSDKGVDKNSDLWQKWNNTLMDAQTRMNTIQAELNSTTTAMQETANATDEAADSAKDYSDVLNSIDKGVKFSNILQGLSKIGGAVKGVITSVFSMGKALLNAQLSGGDWAREIIIEAASAGVSVEEYQARMYAQAVSGISTSAIDEGVKKTIENLGSTDAELIKLYATYGVETRKATGEARDATEVFWETVDALKEIENETSRSIIAQRLFGDQFLNLRPLIEMGADGYKRLVEEGKQNAAVTEESVKALSDMDAAVEKVNAAAEKTKHNVEAQLAPGFTAVADAFSSILNDFNEFAQSEEGKAVFDSWNKSLEEIAATLKEADLEGIFNAIAETASATLESLSAIIKAIDWLIKNNEIRRFLGKPLYVEEPEFGPTPESIKILTEEEEIEYRKNNPITRTDPAKKDAKNVREALEYMEGVDAFISDPKQLSGELREIYDDIYFSTIFSDKTFSDKWVSAINGLENGEIDNSWAALSLIHELKTAVDEYEKTLESLNGTAESGGGGAMSAFNAALAQEGAKTEETLNKSVTEAFKGMDALFSKMGAQHGAAYISALSSQMSRIGSLVSMRPTYYGYFSSGAQSAYASPTSATNLTASLYVGKERVGSVFTPIINDKMGADLQVIR